MSNITITDNTTSVSLEYNSGVRDTFPKNNFYLLRDNDRFLYYMIINLKPALVARFNFEDVLSPVFADADELEAYLLSISFTTAEQVAVQDKLLQRLWDTAPEGTVLSDDFNTTGTVRDIERGGSYDFDGVDDKVMIPHSDSLTFGDGSNDQPFSITGWSNPTNTGATSGLFAKADSGIYNQQYSLSWGYDNNEAALQFVLNGGSNKIGWNCGIQRVPYGSNYFFVMTYDGSKLASGISLYVYDNQGNLLATEQTDTSAGTYAGMSGNSDPHYIGANGLGTPNYAGKLWDVRVHNTELTQAEIDALVADPNSLTGHEVGIWHCDEGAGDVAFDSVGGNIVQTEDLDGWDTISGGVLIEDNSAEGRTELTTLNANSGTTTHYTGRSNYMVTGRNYKVTFDYFIPSSNPQGDTISIRAGATHLYGESVVGQWATISEELTWTNAAFRIYLTDGGIQNWTATGDNFLHLDNIRIEEVVETGKHGTISGHTPSTFFSTQDIVSFQNEVGYSDALFHESSLATVSQGEPWLQSTGDYFEIDFDFTEEADTVFGFTLDSSGNTGIYFPNTSAPFARVYVNGSQYSTTGWSTGDILRTKRLRFVRTASGYDVTAYYKDGTTQTESNNTFTFTDLVFDELNTLFGKNLSGVVRQIDNNGTVYNAENNWNGITWTGGTQTAIKAPILLDSDLDSDVFGRALTYSGIAPKNGELVESHCVTLDGVDDNVVSTNNIGIAGSQNRTISFWAKVGNNGTEVLFDWGVATSDNQFQLSYISSSSELKIGVVGANKVWNYTATDTWEHFLIVLNGTTCADLEAYVDGVALTQKDLNDTTIDTSDSQLYIGSTITGTNEFAGSIVDFRVFDSALTPSTYGSATPVLHYPLAEGAGLTAFDKSGNGNHGAITGTEAQIWANTQDVYHANVIDGFDKMGYFDGLTSFVEVTNASISNAISVNSPFTLTFDLFIWEFPPSGRDNVMAVGINSSDRVNINLESNGRLSFNCYDGSWGYLSGLISKNTYYTIVCYCDGNGNPTSLTFNGLSQTDTVGIGDSHVNNLMIGKRFSGNECAMLMSYFDINSGTHTFRASDGWSGGASTDVGAIKAPDIGQGSLSNPSGAFHNGAETKFKPNPDDDPKLIYNNGVDSSTTYLPGVDGFLTPEYMNDITANQYTDYRHYLDTLTTEEEQSINDQIYSSWTPALLGSDYVVAELDAKAQDILHGTPGTFNNLGIGLWRDKSAGDTTEEAFENLTDWEANMTSTAEVIINTTENTFEVIDTVPDNFTKAWDSTHTIGWWVVDYEVLEVFDVSPTWRWDSGGRGFTNTVGRWEQAYLSATTGQGALRILSGTTTGKVKVHSIRRYSGNEFGQLTGGFKATNNGIDEITFDGVDEFLERVVDSSNYQDLTYFELWGAFYADGVSNKHLLMFNDNGGSSDNRVDFYMAFGNTPECLNNNNSATMNRVQPASGAISTGWHVLGFIADGSAYRIYVDGVEQALTVINGVNNGIMVGDLNNKTLVDVASIGCELRSGGVYTNNRERYQLHLKQQTTEAERARITNYIKAKFGISF